MFIIIKDNKKILKFNLENKIEYKGIVIYKKNNENYISLKDGYFFADQSKVHNIEIRKYEVLCENAFYPIEIYVYENNKGIDDYTLYASQNILLAYDTRANIITSDAYLCDSYLSIKDGYINTNYDISVNKKEYNNQKLSDGDEIEILGNKIYYYDNFLYINNFNVVSKLQPFNCQYAIVKYPVINKESCFYMPDIVKDIKIDKIKKYEPIKKTDNLGFIRSLLPSIIMALSMGIMSYFNIIDKTSNTSNISYVLMPVSICITGVIFPVLFHLVEKRNNKKAINENRNNYIKYLKNYLEELDSNIGTYISSLNNHFFDVFNITNKLFYARKNSDDFLKISIGKTQINKIIEFEYTDDIEINEYLNLIKNKLSCINDYPLYIDLKQNHIVSIISSNTRREYLINIILMELVYKHHYDDVKIALYDKDFSHFDDVYNLPHLFYHGIRLTYTSENKLQELDQMKLDKKVVILLGSYTNYKFSNPNIYVIAFSDDENSLYKDSEAVAVYFNNKGYLYDKEKYEFTNLEYDINFHKYFFYMSKYTNIHKDRFNYEFNHILNGDIETNYLTHDSSLVCNFAYTNNEVLSFDLHESKQGPHGLIGGATGSGKSELLISLLLSLCVRYPCDYLNIVLIDYKGESIIDSLSYNGRTIPHIIGNVSNLADNELNRLIICLNKECIYRQEQFKKLSNLSNKSIMNIDDYLSSDLEMYHLDKIAHLLIVVDEFAELKKDNPEQIKELISLSRIGRSLGIHLILATQRPNGIIDDQIWSNSRFKIALKVFDEKDSMDLIRSKDAAYLDKVGSFILQVDDHQIKAQSLYSKRDINGNNPNVVSILDDNLNTVHSYKSSIKETISYSKYYCKKILDACDKLLIEPRYIDYSIPSQRKRNKLVNAIDLGTIDDYINCKKANLSYSLDKTLLIYSSRNDEINSILNSLNENKIKTIVIGSKPFTGKYICDCLLNDNNEDITYLFNCILNNKLHHICIVIEDLNCLLSYDEMYLDYLCKILRRSKSYNISLICITRIAQISFKLINYFENKIMIEINDKNDLSYFYGTKSLYEGKSFYYDSNIIPFIANSIEEYVYEDCIVDPIIKKIPEIIQGEINKDKYLLGYDVESKEKIYGDKNIKIFSYNNKLIDLYLKYYPNIVVNIYSSNSKNSICNNILWLGSGLFNQRLFICGLKDDINDEEGIYINNGKKIHIRSINYE